MSTRKSSFLVPLILLCTAIITNGASRPLRLIPSSAPAGARVIVTGAGLEDAEVSFATANGTALAEVVSRSATLIECIVPADARSGAVAVTSGGSTIASLPFTVADDPPFTSVATMATSMSQPGGVAAAGDGTLFVAETMAHRIVRLDATGRMLAVIGNGKAGLSNGAAASAQFKQPRGLAYDARSGVLYVADTGNHAIRRVGADGIVSTVAGDGTPGDSDARLHAPSAVAIDGTGAIVVADSGNHKIRRVAAAGTIETIAGRGVPGLADGAADNARFHDPQGVAVSRSGAIFVADTHNHVLRRIDALGVTTIAGTHPGFADGPAAAAAFHEPTSIAIADGGELFVADTKNDRIRVVNGTVVATIAGGAKKGHADGAPLTAEFNAPSALAFNGELWIADTMNGALRVITPQLGTTDLYPRRGPDAGGNSIRIFGTGFVAGATQVRFGNAGAASVTVVAPTELIVTVPTASAGVVDVSVDTRTASTRLTNAYTYLAPPAIFGVTPRKGKSAGDEIVQIQGSDFADGETSVFFGDASADISAVTSSTITATTPAHAAGTVTVRVTTPGGEAAREAAFTYFGPPVISSFSPAFAQVGTAVTIIGSNFDPDAAGNTIRFGNVAAAITSATSTQLTTSVPQGATTAPVSVTTAGGHATSSSPFVVQTYVALAVTPASNQLRIGESRELTATATYADGTTADVTALAAWSSSDTAIATVAGGTVQAIARGTASVTASIAGLSASVSVQVTAEEVPPPDPATIAPEVSPTIPTKLWQATSFLFEGPTPVQRNVAPGAIEQLRMSVLRGHVLQPSGEPLAGVRVSVHRSPQSGYTLSRDDGGFDLAVNGGGTVTLTFEKDGYLPLQRQAAPDWQEYAHVDHVVMTALDSAVTAIDLSSPAIAVARGSSVADSDGARQATLLFTPGTHATIAHADGTTEQVSNIHVRATEYTVGPNGPRAMPAPLPPTSGYTYCVELSVDEAPFDATVTFSKPVVVYVDNFLGFATGMTVPSGYYDRTAAAWKASTNGRVIKILTVVDGLAQVDTDGNGIADAGALAGAAMDDAERRTLASLYTPGKTLWRVPVTHFTPWDYNWPYTLPPGAEPPPPGATPDAEVTEDDGCEESGSILDCGNQSVGERVRIAGTPLTLNYRSNRVPGRTSLTEVDFTLTGATLPPNLKSVQLELSIAGQKIHKTFTPSTNLKYHFQWDGKDGYGRPIFGRHEIEAKIGFAYQGVYVNPAEFNNAFAAIPSNLQITAVRARQEIVLWKNTSAHAGTYLAQSSSLGGWTIDGLHQYDSTERALYQGDGTKRSASSTVPSVDAAAKANFPAYLAFAPDGSLYYLDGRRIRKKSPNGQITHIAGNGSSVLSGNGGPATLAGLGQIEWIALGPDGSVYFVDTGNYVIRRIRSDGIIVHFAGIVDEWSATGDGGPATSAGIGDPNGLAVGPDGAVYVSARNGTIRHIDANGIITSIAGDKANCSGCSYDAREGISARVAKIHAQGLSLSPDGELYLAVDTRIRRIDASGRIWTVAGKPGIDGSAGDGGPALQATLSWPSVARFGPDGMLYICDRSAHRIRRIDHHGLITTVAGNGCRTYPNNGCGTTLADGVAATNTSLDYPDDIAFSPRGELHVAEPWNGMVRRVTSSLPGLSVGDQTLASTDGGLLYVFDSSGRHRKTVDTQFNATLMTYGYDAKGRVTTLTDVDNRVTRIERDGAGNPTAIVASTGERTTFETGGDGYLSKITLPGNVEHRFTYHDGGLLQSYVPPNGSAHSFTYDGKGRLTKDSAPEGGSQSLSVTRTPTLNSTTFTTALGRARTFTIERLSNGTERRSLKNEAGLTSTAVRDVSGNTTLTTPDGNRLTVTSGSDPRFGTQALFPSKLELRTPAGRVMTTVISRSAQLSNPGDALALTTETSTYAVNGRLYRNFFEAASRRLTVTTPVGRQIVQTFDTKGRLASTTRGTLAPVSYSYDAQGRMSSVTQGARSFLYVRDDQDRVTSTTDALNRTTTFSYDSAGRMTRKQFQDGRVLLYGRDAEGNVTSITPPGRPAHLFTFDAVNLPSSYTAPGSAPMTFAYNADRQPTRITRADGTSLLFAYDSSTRLQSISAPDGTYTYGYASTGKLSSISGPNGSLAFDYDGALPTVETSTGAVSGSVFLTYNNDLFVTAENANGSSVDFTYDNDGLLTRAGTMTVTRDPKQRLVTATSIGSVKHSFTFDALGDVSAQTVTFGTSPLFSETMTRDSGGRILTRTEVAVGTTRNYEYSYDGAGRLSTASVDGVQTTYTYDSNSNRLSRNATAATYDAQDRILTHGANTYTWTPNGDLATRVSPSGTTTYDYDSRGNLRSVVQPDQTVIDYVVDALDRRVMRKVNGAVTHRYIYAGDRLIAELDASGGVLTRFVYATRLQIPDYFVRGGMTYRIIADHRGSPRMIVNTADSAVVQMIVYDEFGRVLADSNPGYQPFGFAGGLYDVQTRLLRFGARDYDAEIGRWTARDPLVFSGGSTNLYTYTFGDPVNYMDPNGMLTLPGFGWVDVGEDAGAEALTTYADMATDPNATWYERLVGYVGGGFAALWTPCTSDDTFATLTAAYGASSAVTRYGAATEIGTQTNHYWRYVGPRSNPHSPWLTRGPAPPYGNNYHLAKERLQLPNMPTGVQRVDVRWYEPIRGPRTVTGNGQWGMGEGTEYARGWFWPKN